MFEETGDGNKTIIMPLTRVNNVEGIGRSINTAYTVNDVVWVDNNRKVVLKCVTAGTTNSDELDVSNKVVGDNITDGTVVWKVYDRIFEVDIFSSNGHIVFPDGSEFWIE